MATVKRKPVKQLFQTPHWDPVPIVDHDRPEAQVLEDLRLVLDRTRYNLDVAHEAFSHAYRGWEYQRRRLSPHEFEEPRGAGIPASAANAHTPKQCALCFKEQRADCHGPVPHHPFEPCGLSIRMTRDPDKVKCYQCGFTKFEGWPTAPLHLRLNGKPRSVPRKQR